MELNTPSDPHRLPIVQTFQLGEDLLVSLNKVGQPIDQPGTLEARDVLPPGFAESLPRGRDSNVDVFFRS
jgi:hypothetical protein